VFEQLFFRKRVMSKTVTFRISPQGKTTVKTEGYKGVECKAASEIFENLGQVTSDTPTDEMYQEDAVFQYQEADCE
jgi:hypothetical protein